MVDFLSFVAAAQRKVKARVEGKQRAFARALLFELQATTPKLTGQAAASWLASVGSVGGLMYGPGGFTGDRAALAHGLPARVDVAASAAASGAVIDAWRPGEVLVIYNAVPYIQRLNEGYSPQASPGFVQSAFMRASAASRGQ